VTTDTQVSLRQIEPNKLERVCAAFDGIRPIRR
jgi:hypothetical protein